MRVASSSVPAALCPIVLAAVRAQITRHGPCLWGFPSDPRQETHQGEIIGKERERENKSYRESIFLNVKGYFLVRFCRAPLRCQLHTGRALTGQVTMNLQSSSGRSRAWGTANRKGNPLEIPAADLVETGAVYRAGQIEVSSSVWCLCRLSSCFLTGWILEIGV